MVNPEARAKDLLRQHLNSDQRATFEHNGYFDVKGNVTGTIYRIRAHKAYYTGSHNVTTHDRAYNAWPEGCREHRLPRHDGLLAQKLILEANEKHFLSTACSVGAVGARIHFEQMGAGYVDVTPLPPRRRLPRHIVGDVFFGVSLAISAMACLYVMVQLILGK